MSTPKASPPENLSRGALALVTEDTSVLPMLRVGARPKETLNNIKEEESRGVPVLGLSSEEIASN
jgi:glucosamine 6-phosphate synthetase-like amidotransferase/phosphosugar isomerase protein